MAVSLCSQLERGIAILVEAWLPSSRHRDESDSGLDIGNAIVEAHSNRFKPVVYRG